MTNCTSSSVTIAAISFFCGAQNVARKKTLLLVGTMQSSSPENSFFVLFGGGWEARTKRAYFYPLFSDLPLRQNLGNTQQIALPLNHNSSSHNPLCLNVLRCFHTFQCPGQTQNQLSENLWGRTQAAGIFNVPKVIQCANTGVNSNRGQGFSNCGP